MAARLAFLYEHYERTVIPCINASGVTVTEIPSRDEFITITAGNLFPWNPYSSVPIAQKRLDYLAFSKCKHLPDGLLAN